MWFNYLNIYAFSFMAPPKIVPFTQVQKSYYNQINRSLILLNLIYPDLITFPMDNHLDAAHKRLNRVQT